MNRYFVFRKTHNVNAEKVYKLLVNRDNVDMFEDTDPSSMIGTFEKQDEQLDKAQKANVKSSVIIRKLPGKKMKITIGDEKQIAESSLEMKKVEPKKSTIVIRKKKT